MGDVVPTAKNSSFSSAADIDLSSSTGLQELLKIIRSTPMVRDDYNNLRDLIVHYKQNGSDPQLKEAILKQLQEVGVLATDAKIPIADTAATTSDSPNAQTTDDASVVSKKPAQSRLGTSRVKPSFGSPKVAAPSAAKVDTSKTEAEPVVAQPDSESAKTDTTESQATKPAAPKPAESQPSAQPPTPAPDTVTQETQTQPDVSDTALPDTKPTTAPQPAAQNTVAPTSQPPTTPETVTAKVTREDASATPNEAKAPTLAPPSAPAPQSEPKPEPQPESKVTYGNPLERIKEIKGKVNEMVGNPINLIDANNSVGREYMNALLEAMKKINGGSAGEVNSAMTRLEAAFAAVKTTVDSKEAVTPLESTAPVNQSAPEPAVVEPAPTESVTNNTPNTPAKAPAPTNATAQTVDPTTSQSVQAKTPQAKPQPTASDTVPSSTPVKPAAVDTFAKPTPAPISPKTATSTPQPESKTLPVNQKQTAAPTVNTAAAKPKLGVGIEQTAPTNKIRPLSSASLGAVEAQAPLQAPSPRPPVSPDQTATPDHTAQASAPETTKAPAPLTTESQASSLGTEKPQPAAATPTSPTATTSEQTGESKGGLFSRFRSKDKQPDASATPTTPASTNQGVTAPAQRSAPMQSVGKEKELETSMHTNIQHEVEAAKVQRQAEIAQMDPLMTPQVTSGLQQLLSEWNLFKSSGIFGTGPSGMEHPLYKQIANLHMAAVVAGRFEGASPEVKQSITDYMNGWRYEEGIIHKHGETFEHYLRRVIKKIIEKSKGPVA